MLLLFLAFFAPSLPSAVRVLLGRCAIVRMDFAAAAAFLIFFFAARRCFVVVMNGIKWFLLLAGDEGFLFGWSAAAPLCEVGAQHPAATFQRIASNSAGRDARGGFSEVISRETGGSKSKLADARSAPGAGKAAHHDSAMGVRMRRSRRRESSQRSGARIHPGSRDRARRAESMEP